MRMAIGILVCAAASSAPGQDGWTVTILRSVGFSQGFATQGEEQFGWADAKACSWQGTSETFLNWQQFPGEISNIGCAFGQVRGGSFRNDSPTNAAIWIGGPTGLRILEPSASETSAVHDIDAEGPVGSLSVGAAPDRHLHAVLWRNASERVDLHPPGAVFSSASAAAPGLQAGLFGPASSQPDIHACIWRGSAESMVDLSPTARSSRVAGATGDIQVGEFDARACLWRGTAESRVDLHPDEAHRSFCYDAASVYQVGFANLKFRDHAAIWAGTKASFLDLHSVLPAGYVMSQARSISTSLLPGSRPGSYRYRIDVVGHATPEKGRFDGRVDAILWRLEGQLKAGGPGKLPPRVSRRIGVGKLGRLKFVIDFSKPIKEPVPRWAR